MERLRRQDCVSSMTREQFEKLVKALTPPDRPPMPPDVLRNFATQYAKLLTFSDKARAMGLENDPRVLQIMQFAKNQILTEALNQHITEEYSHPTDQQIEDYYKENSKKYVEVTLQRIIIPRNQGVATAKSRNRPRPRRRLTLTRSSSVGSRARTPTSWRRKLPSTLASILLQPMSMSARGVRARFPRRMSRSST